MSAGELPGRIIPLLDTAHINYMIAGSFASTYHGEPRTTQDIDIVIDGPKTAIEQFVLALDTETYYCDLDAALDAHARRGQFNLVDMTTGWKIDFILRKSRPFSTTEFERRAPAKLLGCDVFVATAEDTIIAKLDWASLKLRTSASRRGVHPRRLGWRARLGLHREVGRRPASVVPPSPSPSCGAPELRLEAGAEVVGQQDCSRRR